MVVDEGDEVFHATSSHEGLEVTGIRINQVPQICTPCNSWKGLPSDLAYMQTSHFPGLFPHSFEVSLTSLYLTFFCTLHDLICCAIE